MAIHPVTETGILRGYLSQDKTVRASVVVMTDLVKQLCEMQEMSPSSSVALGRLLVASVLVSSQLKEDQAISFQISGSEQIKKIYAHAQYDGLCRGFISERQASLAVENNMIALKPLIGEGFFTAMTYIPKNKQPQISQIQLQSGEIGEDVAYYLNQSCQIPCLLSLALKIGRAGEVTAAGGVLIELMPGHTEETLKAIEEHHSKSSSLSQLIEEKKDFKALLDNHAGCIDFKEIRSNTINYGCTCSREKAEQSLFLLTMNDFVEIIASQETLNVDCEMCGLNYAFDFEEINLIYKKSGKAQIH